MDTYTRLLDYISELKIIDTHEHLPSRESEREKNTDIIKEYLTHYFNRDLISAGLKYGDYLKAIDPSAPISERWKLVEPYWNVCRKTGYGRALDITAEGLYNIKQIDGGSIEKLNERFKDSLKPGWYKHVLKDRSNIETSILDSESIDADGDFFTISLNTCRFIWPRSFTQINQIGTDAGVTVCSFNTWIEAVNKNLKTAVEHNVRIFKSALAYSRSLYYPRVTYSEAEAGFNRLFTVKHIPDWMDDSVFPEAAFQNYMMHYTLEFANQNHITYQFHTGIHEGNGNHVSNSNPSLLSNLFFEYPDVNFDLFHIGFPYQEEAGVLAKNFPNVYLDMCWSHIVSQSVSIRTLYEWLDSVPYNKINAFGGDYSFIDAVYAHQRMAREDVCKALNFKIEESVLDFDEACQIAGMLFYDNPKEIFSI